MAHTAYTRKCSAMITAGVAAWAVGVGLAAPHARAAPVPLEPTTQCSDMAHPPIWPPDVGSENPLTRPGQLGGLTQAPGPTTPMPMDCLPIGHG